MPCRAGRSREGYARAWLEAVQDDLRGQLEAWQEPAVGNGDSGGPGYQLVSTADGLKRNAVGIISAIPGGSGTTCQGVPGDSAPGGRKCSSTAYATSVSSIAASLGYYIPVW